MLFLLSQYSHVPLELCMQWSMCILLFKKIWRLHYLLLCNRFQNYSILKGQTFIIIFVDEEPGSDWMSSLITAIINVSTGLYSQLKNPLSLVSRTHYLVVLGLKVPTLCCQLEATVSFRDNYHLALWASQHGLLLLQRQTSVLSPLVGQKSM